MNDSFRLTFFFLIVAVFVSRNSIAFQDGYGDNTIISFDPKYVRFYLYQDKAHPIKKTEIVLDDTSSLKKSGILNNIPVIIMAHGFLGNYTTGGCQPLKNAWLKRDFKNIICLDWGKLSAPNPVLLRPSSVLAYPFYLTAVLSAKAVGRRVADFMYFLIKNKIVSSFDKFHLVGHSLGCHVVGTAGYHVKKDTGSLVGRITGLDPAGPLYQVISQRYQLDKSKGKFVDVLHTNADFFGTPKSLGHVDFFANGGRGVDQPTCAADTQKYLGITALFCGHTIAVDYYERSILGEQLIGCSCKNFPLLDLVLKQSCSTPRTCNGPTLFGQYVPKSAKGNKYVPVPLDPPPSISSDYEPWVNYPAND